MPDHGIEDNGPNDRTWLARALERNRDELLRVASRLFALIRAPRGGMREVLPRRLYFHVLRILRPAESALRRLVMLQEMQLEIPVPACGDAGPAKPAGKTAAGRQRTAEPARTPAFQLFDPFKPFPADPWGDGEDHGDRAPDFGRATALSDEPVNATQLCRRLRALIDALEDIPAQARRLARWRIHRIRPRRYSPLRPGHPPGHRKRPSHDVDEILRECRFILKWAQSPPGSR